MIELAEGLLKLAEQTLILERRVTELERQYRELYLAHAELSQQFLDFRIRTCTKVNQTLDKEALSG